MSNDKASVNHRFAAIFCGQILGVLILVVVGIFPFSSTTPAMATGLAVIKWTIGIALGTSVLGLVVISLPYKRNGRLDHRSMNRALWLLVGVDLVALLFLVCQEGGLSRSMFFPMFFLIPAGYMVVEGPSKTKGTYFVVAVTAACVLISFLVSASIPSKLDVILFSISTTDFASLDPTGYNQSLVMVSLVSLGIPAAQKWWISKKSDGRRQSEVHDKGN